MNEIIRSVLQSLEKEGYEAYIVGGFVRDFYLGKETNDVDIITNAIPKEIVRILKKRKIDILPYQSISFKIGQYNFDLMTYRREIKYEHRIPVEIEYVNNLMVDLERRDFKMNSMVMNQEGKIIDILGGIKDIKGQIITCIGKPDTKFQEDPLRILRAIRFSTVLDFKLEKAIFRAIRKHKKLILTLSSERIRIELDNIFLSKNVKKGFQLLKDCGILKVLGIKHKLFKPSLDICAIWFQIEGKEKIYFTKQEKQQIKKLEEIMTYGKIDAWILFKYGLYISQVAASLLKIDKKDVARLYNDLVLQDMNDLAISSEKICEILEITPSKTLGIVKDELVKLIIDKEIENNEAKLIQYLKERGN